MRQLFIVLAIFSATQVLDASGVRVRWDPTDPTVGPFPNDFLTVSDATQKSGRHVHLPMPADCTAAPSDCQDVELINQLDGFQTAPRISIRFSAPIDVNTLDGAIYFVPLNNLTQEERGINTFGEKMPVNQIIYDPTTNTVYAKPDGNLDQHRRVAIIVTDKIRDLAGDPVEADWPYTPCSQLSNAWAQGNWYCQLLASGVTSVAAEFAPYHVVGASVFTTMNVTTWMEKAHAALPLGPSPQLAESPTVIPWANMQSLTLHFQTGDNPVQFVDVPLPVNNPLFQGVGAVAAASYLSPSYLNDQQVIPYTPTGQEIATPAPNRLYFHVLLPSSPEPATGYPVVIFGHGFGDSQWGGSSAVGPTLARAGFATIAINAVGHGFGPQSAVIIGETSGNSITLTSGGRGVDLNGDGTIGPYEGCLAMNPAQTGLSSCLRQTAVDLSQLVRLIQAGLDLNGDGKPDLDGHKIYYVGESLGSMYGTIFSAIEPEVRAAVLNVGGGTVEDIVRWSPAYHPLAAGLLAMRTPSLLNEGNDFNDNYPFPYQPVMVNNVPGAIQIQNALELYEWYDSPGDPVYYAPHLLDSPLPNNSWKRVLIQFARRDETMPNPASTRLIRAACVRGWTWEYRHDLALADGLQVPQDPHPFLALFIGISGNSVVFPSLDAIIIGLAAQQQVAGYFASDGKTMPDPNTFLPGALPKLFEQPAQLPQDLGF